MGRRRPVSRILFPPRVAPRRTTIIHLSGSSCLLPLATYPEARTGHPTTLPYLVLHRVGFTEHPRSPGDLVRSYRTVAPLPRILTGSRETRPDTFAGRYHFCGTSLHVAVTPCYGAPCPVVFGLSSGCIIQRSFGRRQPYTYYKTYRMRWQWGQKRNSSPRNNSLKSCGGIFM